MDLVWPSGGASSRPPADMSRRERAIWAVAAVLATTLLVVALTALVHFGIAKWTQGWKGALDFSGLERMQDGGNAAAAAAWVAGSQPSALTTSTLNAELPTYTWMDGATNVPLSSAKKPIVGILASGSHIETAVQSVRGGCAYGLTITSTSDPIIAADHVFGPGTYYNVVAPTSQCKADQAPTSGWSSLVPLGGT